MLVTNEIINAVHNHIDEVTEWNGGTYEDWVNAYTHFSIILNKLDKQYINNQEWFLGCEPMLKKSLNKCFEEHQVDLGEQCSFIYGCVAYCNRKMKEMMEDDIKNPSYQKDL